MRETTLCRPHLVIVTPSLDGLLSSASALSEATLFPTDRVLLRLERAGLPILSFKERSALRLSVGWARLAMSYSDTWHFPSQGPADDVSGLISADCWFPNLGNEPQITPKKGREGHGGMTQSS